MRPSKRLLLITCLILAAFCVQANTNDPKDDKKGEPSINGYVSDAESKKPVAGVTISIAGKGQDKREITTDASGNFKTYQLNPGEVTIILEKKGYRTYRKEGVLIKEGVTLKLTVDMEEYDDSGLFHPLLRMMDGK
ncbi:MAG: carboxypeptidase regulatory-like domain-containing protein [Chitinophagaceae bacterium]|nr:carboxypeptidase regulatory-like domain-containing protein [Chitinophagaceae bacterium]